MTHVRMSGVAFGHPGLEPRWTTGAKVGVGTACNPRSRIWFTLAHGIVTEVYYPRLDTANTRDLQFLITDGRSFAHEERRDLQHRLDYIDPHALAYRLINTDPGGRYRISKRVITDPAADALVIRARFEVLKGSARDYALYLLFAPHVGNRGYGNSGRVVTVEGKKILLAWRDGIYTALAASLPVGRASCGFVGVSDGWQDLHDDFAMGWEFASASDGNIALTAEVDLAQGDDFTVALGFGGGEEEAIGTALRAVRRDFEALERRYIQEWQEYCASLEDLSAQATDGGRLFWISAMVLKALEDKTYPGAFIAAPAIPWGEAAGDRNPAGYHLVWPRDLVQVATACLAMGDGQAALRALQYLDRVQDKALGHWRQNFWLDGRPHWEGCQLDEVALPIILAWRLHRPGLLDYDPYPTLVKPAALYLARCGPVTEQERWEENAGYSPSTLAAEIAGLVCAAAFAELHGEPQLARYFREVADSWAAQLEAWTFTTCGQLLPGHAEYYERIATVRLTDGLEGDPNWGCLPIRNLPASVAPQFPQCVLCSPGAFCQCCIVDGGFLELVRYGLRAPDDPHVLKTLPVYDAILKVDTPNGPAWHRYNYDGYGEKRDGSPYDGTGVGRAWPLLTGERGHYELAAGHDPTPYIAALERFANEGGMLPEQVWDSDDLPARGLFKGRGTGAATPLAWAHAEYLQLLRSRRDGRVFAGIAAVYERYVVQKTTSDLAIWKFNHKLRAVGAGQRLRIEVFAPAILHWSRDGWMTVADEPLSEIAPGIYAFEWPPSALWPGMSLAFTFYWPEGDRWEGRDFAIAVV
jgi:glucoamylase